MSTREQWREIAYWPYEVSDLGRVRNGKTKHIIHQNTASTGGYPSVSLCDHGDQKTFRVHVLVAKAFLGPRPDGHEIDHLDRDRLNNRLSNLRFIPRGTNRRQGRHKIRGEKNGQSKLRNQDIERIRESLSSGESQRSIAERFGVSQAAISAIAVRRNWNHV